DANFKYYRDRDYYIKPITSGQNLATFNALGLKGSMAIATCNGGSIYGTEAEHKTYTGLDYITFTAHMDIDLYLMYDTRGGNNRNDISKDAPWLIASGFTADIVTDTNPTPTRYFVETTDGVQYYTVYKKSYLKGEVIHLHGNRRGVTDTKINTNYWVIQKRKGVFTEEPAINLCTNGGGSLPPENVTNLEAITSSTSVILKWINPNDPNLKNVIIRRKLNSAPINPMDGDTPSGTEISPTSYKESGLTVNKNYYYTLFSYGKNGLYSTGVSILAQTVSSDNDNDGLQNSYEDTIVYPTGLKTDKNMADTDGDGINDSIEVAQGTDPTNPDNSKPNIDSFILTSGTPTSSELVTFDITASDNTAVTGWFISLSDLKPASNSPLWSVTKPVNYTLPSQTGSYTIYLWAKDAAGNISESKNITVVKDTVTTTTTSTTLGASTTTTTVATTTTTMTSTTTTTTVAPTTTTSTTTTTIGSTTTTTIEPSLAGYVKDSGGNPIQGALVRLYNTTNSYLTASDVNGYYQFTGIPSGSYYLVVTRDGYTLATKNFTIP
ncbi:MAG TPA: carboxypeptidase regulatory-like domain-containing protein, partial [Spirochaetota bacterium]|nr:carboxypeptidase regulatory-like domain-containing protein [Spirochaetota bacterium]